MNEVNVWPVFVIFGQASMSCISYIIQVYVLGTPNISQTWNMLNPRRSMKHRSWITLEEITHRPPFAWPGLGQDWSRSCPEPCVACCKLVPKKQNMQDWYSTCITFSFPKFIHTKCACTPNPIAHAGKAMSVCKCWRPSSFWSWRTVVSVPSSKVRIYPMFFGKFQPTVCWI